MKTQDYIEQTEKYCAHNYHPLPVVLQKGKGSWVWDVEGNKYLDMLSAYSAVNQGHCHEKIKKATEEQLEKITLTSRAFHNDLLGKFGEKMCKLVGKDKMLPMNTGAEAVETALKAARKWGHKVKGVDENKAEIIACSNNFHGRTISIISMSTVDQYKDGFGPFNSGFKTVEFGSAKALEEAITENTVGFLFEPIQGEGGVVVPPEGYLKKTYEICKENNVLYIADEIQTGFGRCGKMFACDWEDVDPDMIIVGKALSGGFYPISAVFADDEVMSVFNPGDHGSTYGGNPLACAIGIAAIDVLVNENMIEQSRKKGDKFMKRLEEINSPHVKEVRGKGLMIGVEIKKSSGKAKKFLLKMMDEGILAKDTHEQVMRFAPPLNIKQKDLDWAYERIKKVLKS